jgi:predicted dithiol-disulfide oxidoreductase (DUF899 family)
MHDKRFPNESPAYRSARNELLRAEVELRAHVEKVAEQRRRLPASGKVKEDYVFERMRPDGAVESVRLSELFAPGKDSLVVYSFMYGPKAEAACPSCTSLIDGFDATAPHILQRVNMVVVAKSPIERIVDHARGRGWSRIPLLSSHKNSYNTDYWAEDEDENQMPMVNVFTRRDDGVHHFWGSELLYARLDGHPRHVDLLWPLWNICDLTPDGRGTDWYPKLSY